VYMYNNNILAHKIGPLENYTEKVIFFRTAFDRPTTPPANFCNGSAVTAVTSRGGSTEAQIPRGYQKRKQDFAVGTVRRPAVTPGADPLPARHAADLGHHFCIAQHRARRPRARQPSPPGETVCANERAGRSFAPTPLGQTTSQRK